MLNDIQILLFSAIHPFPATVFHSVLLWQFTKVNTWTLLKSRAQRRQGDVQRAAMDQTPWLWVPTVPRVVHLPKLQQHSSGVIPSGNKVTNPAIPAHSALLCTSDHRVNISDPGNRTWLLKLPIYKCNCSGSEPKLLFATSPENDNTPPAQQENSTKTFMSKHY